MTAKTPVYGLEYIVQGEPARGARLALENNAKSIEAALIRGGVAPPNTSDLATLAGRVSARETFCNVRVTTFQDITSTGAVPVPMTFGSATSSPASLWVAGNPTRITAPATGEYDLHIYVPWPPNATGTRGIAYRVLTTGAWVYVVSRAAGSGSYGSEQSVTVPGVQLTAGQYVEVGVWQDSGTTLRLAASSLTRVGLRRCA